MCDFGQALCPAPLSSHFCFFCRWRGWDTDGEVVAQRGDGLCLRPHSKRMASTEPTHKVQRVSMSRNGPTTQPQWLVPRGWSHFITLSHFPSPRLLWKNLRNPVLLTYCLKEPKTTSVYALFLLCRLRLISFKARRSQTQIFTHLFVFKTTQTSRFLATQSQSASYTSDTSAIICWLLIRRSLMVMRPQTASPTSLTQRLPRYRRVTDVIRTPRPLPDLPLPQNIPLPPPCPKLWVVFCWDELTLLPIRIVVCWCF